MEEDQKSKHTCKFCYKIFPCGRSLGGHMRSHLINISSTEKKLPPLTSAKHDGRVDLPVEDGAQFGYGLRENPKKTRKISDKLCKECGKAFHSWKALFGHMKCHSVIGKGANSVEEEDSSDDHHHKPISDNLSSDNEAALCRKKRSERTKRYTNATNSSSSLTEIDQQEQEEVALSLILLSMDSMTSVFESCNNSSESLDGKKTDKVSCSETKSSSADCLKFKFLNEGKLEGQITAPRKRFKINENFEIGCSESEVNSPKTLIKKNGSMNPFGSSEHKKMKKKKWIDSDDSDLNCKFTCIICKKAFPSYQALGGHRASHKKFKGCCAPTSENSSHEAHNSPKQSANNLAEAKIEAGVECKKSKDHECPICFKVFPSGQALGGHKRSHLLVDQAKNTGTTVSTERRIPEIRSFLDLNLPAPVEEDCNEFKPWWIGNTHNHQHEPKVQVFSSAEIITEVTVFTKKKSCYFLLMSLSSLLFKHKFAFLNQLLLLAMLHCCSNFSCSFYVLAVGKFIHLQLEKLNVIILTWLRREMSEVLKNSICFMS